MSNRNIFFLLQVSSLLSPNISYRERFNKRRVIVSLQSKSSQDALYNLSMMYIDILMENRGQLLGVKTRLRAATMITT